MKTLGIIFYVFSSSSTVAFSAGMLVKPKNSTPVEQQCGLVYHIKCQDCQHNFIGETGRNMATRFKEHTTRKGTLSSVKEHLEGHQPENVKIPDREEDWHKRKIKKAIMIQRHHPTKPPQRPRTLSSVFIGPITLPVPQPPPHNATDKDAEKTSKIMANVFTKIS